MKNAAVLRILSVFSSTLVCPCNWDKNFGSQENCGTPEKAGMDNTFLVFCLDKFNSYIKNACDPTDDTSGVVTDVLLNAPAVARVFYSKAKSNNFESDESVDDNGNDIINEVLNGQGYGDHNELCWLRAHKNKEVVMVICLKSGKLIIVGHNGGFMLKQFKFTSGAQSGDFSGFEYNFTNTEDDGFDFVIPDAATYTDVTDFVNTLQGI